jgi:hypothetical protein
MEMWREWGNKKCTYKSGSETLERLGREWQDKSIMDLMKIGHRVVRWNKKRIMSDVGHSCQCAETSDFTVGVESSKNKQ